MNPRWLQRQARLLLSWREQALRAAAGQDPAGQGVTAADALTQARTAQERLEALRAEAQHHIDTVSARLQRLTDQQNTLIESVQSGRLSPAKANRQNQRLAKRMMVLRAEIAACRQTIAADTSEAAGGLVEAPLRRYCALSLQPSYFRWSTMDTVDRRTLIGTLIVILVVVLGIGAYLRQEAAVTFEAFIADRATATILVRCTNATRAPIRLAMGPAPSDVRAYAISLLVQAEDGSYQPLGQPERVAEDDPVRAEEAGIVTVAPGLFHDYRLPLEPVLPTAPAARTIRVECTAPGGALAHSQDLTL